MNALTIISTYTVLHFDEYPILFIGFNDKHQIVIGSLLHENDDDTTLYLYSVVPARVAVDFMRRNISYIDLLREVNIVFLVTKDYDDNILSVEQTVIGQLDPEVLPLPTAYCPYVNELTISKFETSEYTHWSQKSRKKEISAAINYYAFLFDQENSKFSQKRPVKIRLYQEGSTQAHEYRSNHSYDTTSGVNFKSKHSLEHA